MTVNIIDLRLLILFFYFITASRTAEDDSDMLMEPDEVHEETRSSYFQTNDGGFHPVFPAAHAPQGFAPISRSDSPVTDHAVTAEQNFYPFFRESQPLGHSRPYYPTQEPPTRYTNAYRTHDALLGSGDFGVLRGGTFYQDTDPPIKGPGDDYFNYYNNGHGRPQTAPLVRKLTYPEEQFANFKDFADINTPNDAAFSHFVVVYANKNATVPVEHPSPKNIFEQLQMLDEEKKASKFKSKLSKTKLEKKYKKKLGPKNADYEPLLAVS